MSPETNSALPISVIELKCGNCQFTTQATNRILCTLNRSSFCDTLGLSNYCTIPLVTGEKVDITSRIIQGIRNPSEATACIYIPVIPVSSENRTMTV